MAFGEGIEEQISKTFAINTDTFAKTAVTDWLGRWRKLGLAGGVGFTRGVSVSVPRARGVSSLLHLPLEILPCHLVEHIVKGLVKLVQSADDVWVYFGVSSALGLAKAPRGTAVLRLLEAGEPLGLVEVEVLVCYDALEAQEVLHLGHLAGRVYD